MSRSRTDSAGIAGALSIYVDEHRIGHGFDGGDAPPALLTTEHNPWIAGWKVQSEVHRLTSPATYAGGCECDGCLSHLVERGRLPYPSRIGRFCHESTSPHQARPGVITRLLDDHDTTVLARVCGTSVETLRDHYDRADEYRRMSGLAKSWRLR